MHILLRALVFLPLIEILGLIVIGGAIGLLDSLLWLTAAAVLGFYLLKTHGFAALSAAKRTDPDTVFTTADLFNGIAILIASLLLIFPGFISDFLAVPFLIAPLRHWLFQRMKDEPDHFIRRQARHRAHGGESKGGIVIDAEDIHTDPATKDAQDNIHITDTTRRDT